MYLLKDLAIFGAGLAAGSINTIVGSGSLITFPTLLAFGYPAVVANISNTVGVFPGSVSGAVGYRRELDGQRSRLVVLGLAGALGGLLGGVLLFVLPGHVFRSVVPVLILIACALMAAQPRLSAWLAGRRGDGAVAIGPILMVGVFATGVYGGYFGAAQGVILVALLGTFLCDDLQQANALKNVIAALVNGVAAILFIVVGHVAWAVAGILATGAVIGGQVGATLGRRIPARVLRYVIVVGGTVVGIKLL